MLLNERTGDKKLGKSRNQEKVKTSITFFVCLGLKRAGKMLAAMKLKKKKIKKIKKVLFLSETRAKSF